MVIKKRNKYASYIKSENEDHEAKFLKIRNALENLKSRNGNISTETKSIVTQNLSFYRTSVGWKKMNHHGQANSWQANSSQKFLWKQAKKYPLFLKILFILQ